MPSTISTAGLPTLSEADKKFKIAIETAIDTAGLVTFGGGKAITASNGEITIAGMTSNGAILVLPNEATGTNVVTHAVCAAGKATVYINGTTNVAASLTVSYLPTKLS